MPFLFSRSFPKWTHWTIRTEWFSEPIAELFIQKIAHKKHSQSTWISITHNNAHLRKITVLFTHSLKFRWTKNEAQGISLSLHMLRTHSNCKWIRTKYHDEMISMAGTAAPAISHITLKQKVKHTHTRMRRSRPQLQAVKMLLPCTKNSRATFNIMRMKLRDH